LVSEQPPPFELLDHTADVGIVAHGASLEEAFEHAALGMFSVMVELDTVREREERRVEVEADDLEGLLVAWLSELLYLVDTEGLLFRRFKVVGLDERHMQAHAWGEPIDPERHRLGVGIKAVTRHMLAIERQPTGYRVRVIFDI
jgi:SHS2 domain-containing protein